jgi:hypothetical protein
MTYMPVTVLDGEIQDIALDDCHRHLAVVGLGRLVVYSVNANSASEPFVVLLCLCRPTDSHCTALLTRVACEPPILQPRRQAWSRSVHFIENGRVVMACFLDSKEM